MHVPFFPSRHLTNTAYPRPIKAAGWIQPLPSLRAAVVLACAWFGFQASANAQLSSAAQTRLSQQIRALIADKAARTPTQNKLDAQLIYAARELHTGKAHPDAPALHSRVTVEADLGVELDIEGTITEALLADIRSKHGRIINSHPEADAVRVNLPVDVVETVAAREDVRFIRPAAQPVFNAGSVDSQGDSTHQAIQARQTYSATGLGVTVGVLSDSLDDGKGALAAAASSGDIDGPNTFVISGQDGTGSGEGLAMIEIVHDLVPDSKIIFSTGNGGPAQMAANIDALAANGCQIILDDLTYSFESPFQDGVISKAVNAASAQGILYFSSAGNSGNFDQGTSSVWEGDFKDGGDASNPPGSGTARFHLFTAPDNTTNPYNAIVANGKNKGDLTLFWSDPLGKAANDYDLYEVDANGNIVASSSNTQNGSQDPVESISPGTPGDFLFIVKFKGAARFLHIEVGRLHIGTGTAGCVRGHNAAVAPNAFCIAATPAVSPGPFPNPFNANNATETFSSDGPRRMFYNASGAAYTAGNFSSSGGKVFAKPDFTAADGVVTTLPSNSGLNPFYGTSAAAPHAGALAALVLSNDFSLTAAQVGAAMRVGVVKPSNASGEAARDYGTGILLAPKIFAAAMSSEPPTISSFSPMSGPAGTTVTIKGTGFVAPLSVIFGGDASASGNFTPTVATVTVPDDARTGKIRITTNNGDALTATAFTVVATAPEITSGGAANATQGKEFSYQIVANHNPTHYGVVGLPAGLSLDADTGLISGTPTVSGTRTLTLKASNSAGTGTKDLTLTIAAGPPVITSPTTATATIGKPFSYQIVATNDPTNYAVGGQRPGLKLDAATGLISGTPTGATGTFMLTLKAANGQGTATQTLTLTIAAGAPVITSAATAKAKIGTAFSYHIVATNSPTNYAVVGLRPGLTLNKSTGLISGTPTGAAGTFSLTLKAANGKGVGMKTLTLTVTN